MEVETGTVWLPTFGDVATLIKNGGVFALPLFVIVTVPTIVQPSGSQAQSPLTSMVTSGHFSPYG
jgi:hypothetical protein